jgi:hypothetical protein
MNTNYEELGVNAACGIITANTTHLHEVGKVDAKKFTLAQQTKKIRLTLEIEIDCEIPISTNLLNHAIKNSWDEVTSWKEDGDQDYANITEESAKDEFYKHYDYEFYNWIENGGMVDYFATQTDDEIKSVVIFEIGGSDIFEKVKQSAVEFIREYNNYSSHLVDFK